MKTQQQTLLNFFFKDFRVIDKIFKGTKQKLDNFYWSDKPSIKNDLELVLMRKYRAEDKE